MQWRGFVDGERVAPGTYAIALGATDLAGNIAERTTPTPIVARSVALGRRRIEAVVGRKFAVLVVSDARQRRLALREQEGHHPPGDASASGACGAWQVPARR